jgi:hypothetical protein
MDSVTDSLQTAYADVLSFIGIRNCYFLYPDGKTGIVKPLKITETGWTVIAGESVSGRQRLIIQTEKADNILDVPVLAAPCEKEVLGKNCLEIIFPEPFPEWFEQRIAEYRRIILSSEKRSEQRYDVGLTGWKSFGLRSGEQRLFALNKPVKAFLNNVSIHGSLITAEQVPREPALVKAGETMAKLCCIFSYPEEYVFQNAVVVRVEQKTPRLYRYSLRFVEPVALIWQKRIELYRQYLAGGVEETYV